MNTSNPVKTARNINTQVAISPLTLASDFGFFGFLAFLSVSSLMSDQLVSNFRKEILMSPNSLMEKQDSNLNTYRTAIIGNQNEKRHGLVK